MDRTVSEFDQPLPLDLRMVRAEALGEIPRRLSDYLEGRADRELIPTRRFEVSPPTRNHLRNLVDRFTDDR